MVARGDKGNGFVVFDRNMYLSSTVNLISDI